MPFLSLLLLPLRNARSWGATGTGLIIAVLFFACTAPEEERDSSSGSEIKKGVDVSTSHPEFIFVETFDTQGNSYSSSGVYLTPCIGAVSGHAAIEAQRLSLRSVNPDTWDKESSPNWYHTRHVTEADVEIHPDYEIHKDAVSSQGILPPDIALVYLTATKQLSSIRGFPNLVPSFNPGLISVLGRTIREKKESAYSVLQGDPIAVRGAKGDMFKFYFFSEDTTNDGDSGGPSYDIENSVVTNALAGITKGSGNKFVDSLGFPVSMATKSREFCSWNSLPGNFNVHLNIRHPDVLSWISEKVRAHSLRESGCAVPAWAAKRLALWRAHLLQAYAQCRCVLQKTSNPHPMFECAQLRLLDWDSQCYPVARNHKGRQTPLLTRRI